MSIWSNGNFVGITIMFCVRFGKRKKEMTSIYACYYIRLSKETKNIAEEKLVIIVREFTEKIYEKKKCHKTTKESYTITTCTGIKIAYSYLRSLSLCWQQTLLVFYFLSL